jgi:hypothetical protein
VVGVTGAGAGDGAVFTVDVLDRDAEVKLLVGCTAEEVIVGFHNGRADGSVGAMLVMRPGEG